MTWSKEKPTVPGYYWYRNSYRLDVARITGLSAHFTTGLTVSLEHVNGEWSGPLEPPVEVTG